MATKNPSPEFRILALSGGGYLGLYAAVVLAELEERGTNNPAGRYGQAQEIGALCAFVCSAHAGYITGQNLLIDGGAYPGTY